MTTGSTPEQRLDLAASGDPNWTARLAGRFYDDRRLLALILALILVAGASSFAVLPRMEDPVLRRRVALINTRLPGANAERVESLITEKIENQLRDIQEVKELRSVSRIGISTVAVELRDQVTETDIVWSRVRSRLEDSIALLPPGASRPSFDELEVRAYALILGVVWNRPGPPDTRLLRRLAIDLQDRMQNLSGTELVDLFGDPGEEIRVTVDPGRAASMGLTLADISARVVGYDAKSTAGQLRNSPTQMLIEVGNQLDALQQLAEIPVAQSAGRDTRLGDVARVSLEIPDPPERAALLDGREAVVLGAMVRPAVRIDQWTERAEAMLADYTASLPEGIVLDTMLRQSSYVDARLQSLSFNLLAGALAVSLVIWMMMGWRSAIIVTLTLPLACLMVLFGLRLSGISLHQMSITGLIIALGLLIDNAIVVVDEVKSRLRSGMSPRASMASAVAYLAVPLFGSTLTTALAFAPIALMPGPAGEFVGSIAISVMFAIFSSLFLALTVIPAFAAMSLSRVTMMGSTSKAINGHTQSRRWLGWHEGVTLPRMATWFRAFLTLCLRRPWVGVASSVMLPALGIGLATTLPEQFFPPSGRDQFYITVESAPTTTLAQTRRIAQRIDAAVRELGARRVDWFYGESAPQFYYNVIANRRGVANFSQALVTLSDEVDASKTIATLQTRLDREILSSRVLVRQLEQGPPFEAPVEVRLFGPDVAVLRQLGDDVRSRLASMPEVAAVRSDLSEVLPQLSFAINEGAAVQAGVTPAEVARQLSTALEGAVGGSVLQDNEELPVVVRVADVNRGDLARIESMGLVLRGSSVTGSSESTYQPLISPVSALASVSLQPESAAIPRLDRRRMNEVNAYLRAGILPSVVQSKIETSLAAQPLMLPAGYSIQYGGEASKRDDAVGNLFSTVGLLTVMMAATLVLSFGSFRLAGLIAAVAALSMGLGMLSLAVGGYPFGFMAIIGTMGLIGVAINDSIVVLAGIRANPQAVAGDVAAVAAEVMHSTRHVIATTLTTVVGFAPLIMGGGQFWPPMAVCIAGGVTGATLLALVLVPSLHQWLVGRSRRLVG